MPHRGEGCAFLPQWARNGQTYTGTDYMIQYRGGLVSARA